MARFTEPWAVRAIVELHDLVGGIVPHTQSVAHDDRAHVSEEQQRLHPVSILESMGFATDLALWDDRPMHAARADFGLRCLPRNLHVP